MLYTTTFATAVAKVPEVTASNPGHNDIDWQTVGVITAIVVATVTGVAFLIAKIFNLGKVSQRLETVEREMTKLDTTIKSASTELGKRIDDLMMVIAQKGLTESHSPRQLSTEGQKVLASSGIEDIVNDKYPEILKKVKAEKPENAYRAEQVILDVVSQLKDDPTLKDRIEKGAFNSGVLASVVLFVGAINVRDRILTELKLSPDEIDQHDPNASKK